MDHANSGTQHICKTNETAPFPDDKRAVVRHRIADCEPLDIGGTEKKL
jgi:hypothetical protein